MEAQKFELCAVGFCHPILISNPDIKGNSANGGSQWRIGMAVDPRRAEAKKLSLEQGLTQAAIAQQLGVSTRTIERWASEDGWGARKKAEQKVISINAKANAPEASNPPSIRSRQQGKSIDEVDIVEGAIDSLSHLITGMGAGSEGIDTRSIGSVATALVRLLEYRRKICPPTAALLAEQAIALNLSPQEFVAELKRQWQLRA